MAYRTRLFDRHELHLASQALWDFSINAVDGRTLPHFVYFNVVLWLGGRRRSATTRSIGVRYGGKSFDVEVSSFQRSFKGCYGRGCPPSWLILDGVMVPGSWDGVLLWFVFVVVVVVWFVWFYGSMFRFFNRRSADEVKRRSIWPRHVVPV